MKIYGTAKGGALSKKDFGVAFGGGNGGLEPTLSFDFTDATGWVFNNSDAWITTTSGGSLNIKCSKDGTIQGAVYPFSIDSITLEEKWVLRAYNVNWQTDENYGQCVLGFTDLDQSQSEVQNHWAVAGQFDQGSQGGVTGAYLILRGWTSSTQYSPFAVTTAVYTGANGFSSNDPSWIELSMDEGTLTSKFFDNDDFDSTPVSTNTDSTYVAGQSTNTSYLSLKNIAQDIGETGVKMQLSIDELKFWNGVSEV